MVICQFFLQGRCRFGDKCWNEHPRDGGGGGRHQNRYQQPPPPPQYAGASRSWNAPPQRNPPPKSKTWTNPDNSRTTFGSFSGSDDNRNRSFQFAAPQNRFSALATPDHNKEGQADKDGNIIDDIMRDLEVWVSSGQWPFSVYSVLKEKRNIPGFADVSPEELRFEFLESQGIGNLQGYVNAVEQLVASWKERILNLQNLNTSSKAELINELTSTSVAKTPTGFGGLQQSTFASSSFPMSIGPPSASTFSFKADATSLPTAAAGSSFPGFGSKPTVTPGFGSAVAPPASSFSFASTTASSVGTSLFGSSLTAPSFGASASTSVHPGFGGTSVSAATFSFGRDAGTLGASSLGATAAVPAAPSFGFGLSAMNAPGFGGKTTTVADLFKSGAAASSTTSIFGQPSTFSASIASSNTPLAVSSSDCNTYNALFTPRTELSADDLFQFQAKKFTLGKIPLQPPPADLMVI
ncbi:nucleoporin NUP42 [Pelodytes ibericus]